jgi:hypothetical protein
MKRVASSLALALASALAVTALSPAEAYHHLLISFSRDSVLAFAMDWSAPALFSPPRPTRAASSSFLRQQGS